MTTARISRRCLAVAALVVALFAPVARAQQPRVFTSGTPAELELARASALAHLAAMVSGRGINVPDDLVVSRAWVDQLSMAHVRAQQYYHGIPVFGGEAIVHFKSDGELFGETDNLVSDVNVNSTARVTSGAAIAKAIAEYGCSNCLTAPPTAELWILRYQRMDHLTFRVELRREDGTAGTALPVMFVDAHTGELVWRYDRLATDAPDPRTSQK